MSARFAERAQPVISTKGGPEERVDEVILPYEVLNVTLEAFDERVITEPVDSDCDTGIRKSYAGGGMGRISFNWVDDCYLAVNYCDFDTEPPLWGGCELIGVTNAQETLHLWRNVAVALPGTYLHSSEAVLYTFEGFMRTFIVT